jgi:predicted metal-dependent hydrolase
VVDNYVKFYDPKIIEIKNRLSQAIPEIKKINLAGSNRSFTINKKDVYICTKDNNGQYYNDNMLTYVLLHELAHVLCDEVGHTEKFKHIFQSLLDRAKQANLYNPNIPPNDDYCNT